MQKEDVAKIAHEVNRAYCEALGDDSQIPWEDAPGWMKESAITGVDFHAKNPEAGPEASHESWMAQKEADGWIYGEEKDAELKTHPCMVLFSELPVEQQAKGFIFRAVVHSIIGVLKTAKPKAAPVAIGVIGIQYIGGRESHQDNLYGTGLIWTPDQVHNVPTLAAKKMLAHADVYAKVDANDEELVAPPETDDTEAPPKIHALLPNFDAMSKKDMQDYAQQHYGEKMHHAMSEDNMRNKITSLIGERGLN